MKSYFWMIGFLGIFLLSGMSPLKLRQKISVEALPVQNKNLDLVITSPICLDRSNIPKEELHWLYMPNTASELATNEYYGYLSGKLISSGAVNASDCPLNGLWPTGYANSCGLEKTREASLYLQNVYDDEILAAGKSVGVPPVMIKQLIRYESQFWPERMGLYHFGLGHITFIGAMNAVMWDRGLFENMNAQLSPETTPSVNSLANQLLITVDATCPSCAYKINVPKAEQSINSIARSLLGYCKQTAQVVSNATNSNASAVVDYATIWKLTLLNYNVGPSCVYQAVQSSYGADVAKSKIKLSWNTIAKNIDNKSCLRGIPYVENITREYYDFGITP